jgi:hypothetical protein
MRPFRFAATLFLASLTAASGCVRSPASLTAAPSSLFVRQYCPGAEIQIVGEFEKGWSSWGLLGWPIGGRRDVAARVDIEVERLGGDASMDVKIDTEYRLYDFSQFIPFMLPILVTGYYVSGKVIRYTGTDCGAG